MQVTVLCGSMGSSLVDLRTLERELTEMGRCVLFPVPLPVEDHDPFADAMHLARIHLARELEGDVWAVPKPDGSFGVSTRREMEFASLIGLMVVVAIPRTITPEGLRNYLISAAGDNSLQPISHIPKWAMESDPHRAVLEEFSNA